MSLSSASQQHVAAGYLGLKPHNAPLICSLLDAILLLYRSGGFTAEPSLRAEHAMEFRLYAMRENEYTTRVNQN